jgi:ASC-1-like (ASCH) protein
VRTKTLWIKDEYLDQILRGEKDVEVRVGYRNISRLQEGDVLLLNDEHCYEITRVARYASHEELLEREDTPRIAPGMSRRELLGALRRIYPSDTEALGVIALEIAPLEDVGT